MEQAIAEVLATGWRVDGPGVRCSSWTAVLSSRLGRPLENRGRWFAMLERVVLRARRDRSALLVADGTAAEPWVCRAAGLYGVPLVHLHGPPRESADHALAVLAHRIFALWVRRGGRIEQTLGDWLRETAPATGDLYVGVWKEAHDASQRLMRRGAVGWYLLTPTDGVGFASRAASEEPASVRRVPILPLRWMQRDRWVVHCTRARRGPFPWQSDAQWRDEVLLGGDDGDAMGPAEVLERILREGIVRGAALRNGGLPVVCFSEVPLRELLARRTFRSHRGRWDYEPYGLAIRREVLERLGGAPVVYAENRLRAGLGEDQQWRFQARGRTFDWTAEREWRICGSLDLNRLGPGDASLFVGDAAAARRMADISRWPVILAD